MWLSPSAIALALYGALVAPAPQETDSLVASALPVPEVRTLIQDTHVRLAFEADVTRVAVGRSETLSVDVVNSRELLVLGREAGRTSLVVWFADGRIETLLFSVQPDLSFLRAALLDIHPAITVDVAPDRPAVVLRGIVPDVSYFRAAGAAAAAYLDSRSRKSSLTPFVSPDAEGGAEDGIEGPGGLMWFAGDVRALIDDLDNSEVINLIQVEGLPPRADEKILQALEPIAGGNVTVRRVLVGELPDDDVDLFVLEGSVPDQVTLSRVLFLASRALQGADTDNQIDIKVLADEAGALTDVDDLFGAAMVGGGGAQGGGGLSLGRIAGQQGGQQRNQFLVNRIGSNLGRAKVVEAASGRILSMLTVENLPLVRVDVRLYEVNLTRLREWGSDFAVLASDFDQGALQPAPLATALQGNAAASIGQDDIQNIFGFLGGELGNQTQLVTGGFAVESLFTLLVNEQIARSLSRPTLTVLSGELALFQVGGQVPVPVAVTVGGGTDQVLNAVEFRDFGVQLTVRPLVEELDSETITLDLQPTVSLPDLDLTAAINNVTGTDTGTTAFETRGTRTHTRLRDGDAMLIGGLISQREETALAKTPGLGDIPLAGWLFRNEVENEEDFELVIVVNPVIVRPERPDAHLWSFAEPADMLADCLASVRETTDVEPAGGRGRDGDVPAGTSEDENLE